MTHDDAFTISRVAHEVHRVNVDNGWWRERDEIAVLHPNGKHQVTLAALALVVSEVAEAMEAVRKHDPTTWADTKTKDTFARELAGATLRIMDLAAWTGVDLGEAIRAELEANKARGYKHGGKAA
jgi:NTP pyrophosphatase (non-canonical NTP hydrolase)